MNSAHTTLNGAVDTSWRMKGTAPDCPDAARPGTDQKPETFPASPTPVSSVDENPRPQCRTDLLRRALTSPWRRLAPSSTARAEGQAVVERSCHVFGAATITRPVGPAFLADISVSQRIDRRSASSAKSQRSLFTIDGLPEGPAPDPSIQTTNPSAHHITVAIDGGGDGDFSISQHASRSLHRAATALDGVVPRSTDPNGPRRHLLRNQVSSTTGTGFQGSVHHLLRLPGGADAYVQNSHVAALATQHLLPQGCDGAATLAPDGLPPSTESLLVPGPGPTAAPPRAPNPSQLGYDNVRNPMSFDYDPSLTPLEQQPSLLQEQQNCTALPYSGQQYGCTECGGRSTSPADNLHTSGGVGRDVGRCGSGGMERPSPADGNAAADPPYYCDGDDVEVVASEGPFVVLEMKGPRGTPSTRAAATTAFLAGASASPAAPDAAVALAGMSLTLRGRMASYFSKWAGVGDTLMPGDHPVDVFWSWLGAFLSILVVAVLNQYLT
ncbi:hypothetical protein Vafri_14747 [Volvox africanus]|uniref:Uncharacterized protein n=1 Tax=Volvox africanus TaxID=51714 RepID=A0A8J4F735_9CHLO|nr:hypothetical protein Vafri_14747 [Volvox africanus]